jgi:hypothetical protein
VRNDFSDVPQRCMGADSVVPEAANEGKKVGALYCAFDLNSLNGLNVLNDSYLMCARFTIVTIRPPAAMQASTRYIQK